MRICFERGQQKLAEMQQEIFASCKALNAGNMRYMVDYDLGMLSPFAIEIGHYFNARITEVTETYEGNDEQIDLTFDNSIPEITDKVRRRINNVSVEAKR